TIINTRSPSLAAKCPSGTDALPTVAPPARPDDPARRWWPPMPTRSPLMPVHRRALAGAVLLLLAVPGARARAAEGTTGEQIYRKMCASCHGNAGEGTKEYPRPLAGDRSVP